jgi:hypothetical protein
MMVEDVPGVVLDTWKNALDWVQISPFPITSSVRKAFGSSQQWDCDSNETMVQMES